LKLWIVRHGQTDWNTRHLIQGWTDIPLNTAGREQAGKLLEYISGIQMHGIFSSDLARAYETAQILSGNRPDKIRKTEFLRERCFGSAEGRPRTELDTVFMGNPSGSEPKQEVILRGTRFLNLIANEYPRGRYLCVAHGGLIRAILEHLNMNDVPTLSNTSVTVLELVEKHWVVKCVNWHKHLADKTGTFSSDP
jgi:uncharacterized phosphatase